MTQRVGSNRIANNSITLQKLSNLSDPNLAFNQANSSFDQANAAFIRANNSLDANNGGTITANLRLGAGFNVFSNVISTVIAVDEVEFNNTTLSTTVSNGTMEYSSNTFYATSDETQGRGYISVVNYCYLQANANYNISTAALPFMGNSKGITLSANSAYEIEWNTYFRKTTAGTVTFAIRFGAAPQLVNAIYWGGRADLGGPANSAGRIVGTADPFTLPATPTLGTNTVNAFNIKALIISNETAAGNCYLQALTSTGTITANIGSYMKVTKLPRDETGIFA